ncbi:hypothetical protein, partial [Salmonella enterica]|uniref:hypothetical protein n=1 Tax=Salmonella enterica TaxID=28901 RepID=UPI003D2ED6CE
MGPTSPNVAVYPRWRGEHVTFGKWKAANIGLSRWRGNTQKVPVVPDERPVYPRWRGEHRAHFRKIQIIHG